MFAFEVEYLLGRSFAGDFRNRSEPEWPPHPGRLFAALAAAHFENGPSEQERRALEWLERQPAPEIRAGEAGEAVVPQAFVPTNYPGDHVPVLRGKQPRYFPAQGPEEATVYFIWPEAEPSADVAAALDELASRTGYLGKSCSVIRMRITDQTSKATYRPEPGGRTVLRVPSPGRLQELERLFSANQRPTLGAQQRYLKIDSVRAEGEPSRTVFGQMAVFRKVSGPDLPIEATLTLTSAVRQALMANAGSNGPIAGVINGHEGSPHCAILALPFVGHKHSDGHLMGFAVAMPREIPASDRRAVLAACVGLGKNGLHISGVGDWRLEAVESTPLNWTLRTATWTRPSLAWTTVSPILLDRFPKKKGPTVEELLHLACERVGLPWPISVRHSPYSPLPGVAPVPAFRLLRKKEERPRWGVHAELKFAQKVQGPVMLGAGRFFGLGLMRPIAEDGKDDNE